MLIVTIDSGTTNTRVRIWKGRTVIANACEAVGIRDTVKTGNQDRLIKGIKKALDLALGQIQDGPTLPQIIVASGMITSEVGLCHLPHLTVPVSLKTLARGTISKTLPEISPHPIWFIPGVKNSVADIGLHNYEMMDVMRGEEVETFGLLSQHKVDGPALIILPGSHSKFIHIDEKHQIVSSATTMAGELLDVLTNQTILANSLHHQFANELDIEYLLKGATACQQVGIARSCFSVRILDLFTAASTNQKANFLLGAALYSDLLAIKNSEALALQKNITVIISGKAIMKEALAVLIKQDASFTGEVILINEDPNSPFSGIGAIELMKEKIPNIIQKSVIDHH
ncbi:2-dehydro-3-deoxygalactonokinase [Yersinia pekkanenii]|uniref:2-keto-3-deoxy-galactonokinase n=1 Tax=Yersinia pekkanenii TaxID=1288385 RepID=A0A0T9NM78_9GAMM|nr:2-dehydro-3-deoxygalactonokinase [Yersinia pekkanenii]CNH19892.1 2-keto-3-deoxy-galactonokinase [Yersinia pekkanenii]CRY66037.1 2-keto-3-deoxy-galactonokinase [Yersinia pekkanenii]